MVGVNVTKASAAPNFVVEWDSVGAVALLVGGPSSLTPASAVVTSQLQAGSASAVERQIVRLTRQPYALQTVWSTIADGWSARLDCNTRGLLDFLGGSVSAGSTLELQLVDASQNVRTVGQVDCVIRNEAIDEASTIPTPFPSYMTATQVNQNFLQNRFQVTALDGGGTALDGIPTGTTALPTVPTDALVAIELGGDIFFYELVVGTDAESLPDVVRPDDFATTTNERVWLLRAVPSALPLHASTHEDGGADEISVAGLSGLLADGQTPLTHASTHASAGSDPLTLAQSQVSSLTTDLAAKLPLAGGTMTGQLNFSGTTHAGLKLLSLTTTQRNALTAANGMLIYNTTTATVQKYEAGAWVNSGTPAAHASTHASAGSDPLTLAQSQVTSLTTDLAAKLPLAGGTMTGQLNFSGTTHAGIKLLSLTTVQRDALTAANGMLIYNTTTATVQKREAGAWVNSGTPATHASTHQNGGADEISVAGLSGLLADGQTPLTHASTHASAGSDPLTLAQSQVTSLTTDLAAKLPLAGGTMTGQLNFSGTTHAGIKLLSLTTVQRDALTAANGMLIYNTTTATVQKYEAGAWAAVGSGSGGYSLTATTTDATQTELLTAASARLTLPDNTAWGFTALFTGRYNGVDGFNTWTARESNRQWESVASSSDGVKLVAVVVGGQIYTSTDSGATWTARDSNRAWYFVASSADGTKLAAVVGNGQIYTSTDSGATWTARDSNRLWYSVASSSDGTKLVACDNAPGQIYTSTDSGVTWTARDSSRFWRSVASSSDGVKLVACDNAPGQIYTSTDSGVTWTARDSSRFWRSVASSSDGVKLVAVVVGGQIYTSTDSGATWTARDSSRGWRYVASSSDGTKLVAGVQGGQIYTSTDSGVTWTARDSSRQWHGVASSSDGTKLVAGVNFGQIYTSTSASTPAAYETCEFKGHAVRDSGAASMSISALQENPIGTNTAGRFVCQADLTNGALQFLATGAASQAWKWGVSIQTVEVTP